MYPIPFDFEQLPSQTFQILKLNSFKSFDSAIYPKRESVQLKSLKWKTFDFKSLPLQTRFERVDEAEKVKAFLKKVVSFSRRQFGLRTPLAFEATFGPFQSLIFIFLN